MTTTSANTQTNLSKFQGLLRELFQFDCADLDFGIYRIMNHKRDAVERFITEQLPAFVTAELDSGPLAQQAWAEAHREEVAQRVRAALGDTAIDHNGGLAAIHHSLPIGQEYLEAQQRAADGSRGRDAVEAAIYNHLYTFFARYYEEGDFISKRRYSRNQRYAIPYNGEEVYLHWANSDQYYVKTDEHFRNYDWKAPNGVSVHFRLKNADVEQNNVKGERRFFIPRVSETEWDAGGSAITIPFEYRPLSGSEPAKYGRSNQQDKIIEEAVSNIPGPPGASPEAIAALSGEHNYDGNGPVSRLEHHLRRYVRRNNSDFFIHRDLAGFLNRELDFYLKNEVLNLDNLTVAGQDMAEGWFQQMRLTKGVGGKIIDFLAQIEDFQKMLWEKRKFVTETQYCITLGNIAPEFHAEIAANEAQWDDWRDLFGVEGSDRSDAFLRANSTLVLDTKHFDPNFTGHLLASFDDLEGMTDGLLVHSENWQALRLLLEKYTGSTQCIYLDPPYNSKTTEILYKNDYRHSSWLSLMDNRLAISGHFATPTGSHVIAIDENEQIFLGQLMMRRFQAHNNICVSVIHNKKGIQGDHFSYNHDFAYFSIPRTLKSISGRPVEKSNWAYVQLRKWGSESERSTAKNCFFPIYVKGGEVVGYGDVCDDGFHPGASNVTESDGRIAVYPVDSSGVERKWRYARSSIQGISHLLRAHTTKSGEVQIQKANEAQPVKTVWDDARYIAGDYGTRWLTNLGLKVQENIYPKSVHTVEDSIRLSSDEASLTMDYFAGSGTTGHAVINLNREDGGQRKFILVEMGEYFDTVLLPRIKKVTYTSQWKNGKPQRVATAEEAERSPRIVKYVRLESYEDALDSIEFDQLTEQLPLTELGDEYLLKYMLRWETKDSETLLNPAKLTSPFSYRLRVHANGEKRQRTVDLAETFNYLLGLKVKTRQACEDNGRRYLVYRGETRAAPGRTVAVIWRATEGWTEDDFAQDRDFVVQHNLGGDADTMYVNGDSAIPGAKAIEPVFKARMFAGVSE